MFKRNILLTTMCVLTAMGLLAQTQITSGVIRGRVLDQTDAVLPGVTVEVRNTDTNLMRTIVTDGEGRFAALALPPGPYVVTLTLQGFARFTQDGVILTVGRRSTSPYRCSLPGPRRRSPSPVRRSCKCPEQKRALR